MEAQNFSNLDGARFMNLTTFKKSGEPRTTPVWFVREGETLYVMTDPGSYKVRRLRNNPAVRVGPSTYDGKPIGPEVEARGQVLPESDAGEAITAMRRKYRLQFVLFRLAHRIRGLSHVFLRITP